MLLILAITSCVSSKKFDAVNKRKTALEAEVAECHDSLTAAKQELGITKQALEKMTSEAKRLRIDSVNLSNASKLASKLYEDEAQISDRLRKDYKELLSSCSAKSSELSSNLSKKESQLIDLEKSLQDTKMKNEKLSLELKDRETRVKELEDILKKKDLAVNELKNKVSNALLSFNGKDLSVQVKNGKVYVSLSEQLLFKSGSTAVDKKGEDALKKLSAVLKDQTDINVLVEGHTDDVPIAKGSNGMKDNWDLSVLRATEIVRILTLEGGLNAQRVTPAGRGEFSPLADGKSSEARSKNRRTEIILTPKLDELFKILESN